MLLEQLCAYAERLTLPPTMYVKTRLHWLLDLDHTGRLLGWAALAGQGRPGQDMLTPHIGRSSGVRAKLLADNGAYVLGLPRTSREQSRVAQCHAAFVELVRQCEDVTHEPTVAAVSQFLARLLTCPPVLPRDFDPAHLLTFRVDGILPITLPSVRHFWAFHTTETHDERPVHATPSVSCLVCSHIRPPVKRLPVKIKRIPGGQSAGMALSSANVPAFVSYGLEASLVAPICQPCGERISQAANALFEDAQTHLTIGPLVSVCWTQGEDSFAVLPLLAAPEAAEVQALRQAVRRETTSTPALPPQLLYAAALSASGARVVVRDMLTSTVPEVQRHLARYFTLQQLVGYDGTAGRPLGLYALCAATVRDAPRQLCATAPQALLRLALAGGALPLWLLAQALQHNRAEQSVSRHRAALIKMVLLSQPSPLSIEEHSMLQLDPGNHNPAYLCGRLLALLEAVQRLARPGLTATVTTRFFSLASTSPAAVFGLLLRGAQAHLSTLRQNKRAAYEVLERQLEEVQASLSTFPKTLTMLQQGMFSLGYYHQRAAERAGRLTPHHPQAQEGRDATVRVNGTQRTPRRAHTAQRSAY